ncbi:MAG: GWxTD domain-containing protein, partial [candidate division Zixibacteria bacterium]
MSTIIYIRRSLLILSITSFLLLSFTASPVEAFLPDGGKRDGTLALQVDWAQFRVDDSAQLSLEIYYKIPHRGFAYKKQGEQFVADYEIMITVSDKRDNQIDRHQKQRSIRLASEIQTKSRSDFRSSMARFNLDPGKYKVDCYLTDRKGEAKSRITFEVKLRDLVHKRPRLSGVQFAQAAMPVGEETKAFVHGNLQVIPSVSRGFGSLTGDKLLYYTEIYNGTDELEKITVETILRKASSFMVYRDTLDMVFDEWRVRQFREINLGEMEPGLYELEINLRGRRFKKLDQVKSEFAITWTAEALVAHDFETAVKQMDLISDPGELDGIKKAKTPEERLNQFNLFWSKRDPTPGDDVNEAKIEFYRRVSTANHNFAVMNRDGWQTDRGRIYIRFGPPDQIDDV